MKSIQSSEEIEINRRYSIVRAIILAIGAVNILYFLLTVFQNKGTITGLEIANILVIILCAVDYALLKRHFVASVWGINLLLIAAPLAIMRVSGDPRDPSTGAWFVAIIFSGFMLGDRKSAYVTSFLTTAASAAAANYFQLPDYTVPVYMGAFLVTAVLVSSMAGSAQKALAQSYLAQNELERTNQNLNTATNELKAANQSLLYANDTLRELDQIKTRFIASMSRELRTPLNAIIGFASLLKDEAIESRNARLSVVEMIECAKAAQSAQAAQPLWSDIFDFIVEEIILNDPLEENHQENVLADFSAQWEYADASLAVAEIFPLDEAVTTAANTAREKALNSIQWLFDINKLSTN